MRTLTAHLFAMCATFLPCLRTLSGTTSKPIVFVRCSLIRYELCAITCIKYTNIWLQYVSLGSHCKITARKVNIMY